MPSSEKQNPLQNVQLSPLTPSSSEGEENANDLTTSNQRDENKRNTMASHQLCVGWVAAIPVCILATYMGYSIVGDLMPATAYQCRLVNCTMGFTMTMENATIVRGSLSIGTEDTWHNITSNQSSTTTLWHLDRIWSVENECNSTSSLDYSEQPMIPEIGTEQECFFENRDNCQVTFTQPNHSSTQDMGLGIFLLLFLVLIALGLAIFMLIQTIRFCITPYTRIPASVSNNVS